MKKNTEQKKILFITPHFPPNDSVGTQRIVKFIKYLHRRGWKIFVLTLKEKYYQGSANNYVDYLPESIRVFRTSQINFFGWWDWIKKYFLRRKISAYMRASDSSVASKNSVDPSQSFLKKCYYYIKETVSVLLQYPDLDNGWVPFIFVWSFYLIKRFRIPFVFVSSPPPSPHVPINILKKFIYFKYIADLRDPWSRSQWENPSELKYRIVHRLDVWFEEQTIQSADYIFFNTPALKDDFLSFYSNPRITNKFFVLINGYDPEFRERLLRNLRFEKQKNSFIEIVHAGTLYKKRNPAMIIDALAELNKRNPELVHKFRLRFIGYVSDDLRYLDSMIKKHKLADVVQIEGKKTYQEVLEIMALADWLLLLQPGTTIQIPAKFFDYLLLNKPIWAVVEKNSICAKVVRELNIGISSDCQSLEEITNFFESFSNPQSATTFHVDEQKIRKYSVPYLVESMENILLNHRTFDS